METSARISSSFLPPRGIPVRKDPDAPACAMFQFALNPERTSILCLKGASGSRMGVSSNSAPKEAGVQ